MIPKIIHYCWFGGNQLPDEVKKYMETWKRYCPDYEIKEWNESNFDINQNQYCREAYEAKKWAFVSDYARLKVLYDYGGIYMDTDVEVCKSFGDLLGYNAWLGFEAGNQIQTGVIASCKKNKWIENLLDFYKSKHFNRQNGTYDTTTNVTTITRITKDKYNINLNNKFQVFGENNALFPFEFFCAKSTEDGKVKKSNNTYTIHHFSGSWLTPQQIWRHKVKLLLVKIFGVKLIVLFKRYFLIKTG